MFYKADRIKNLPPSPPKLPILGNFHQLGSLPHQNLHSLAGKHGPLMLLHFGRVPVMIVSSADTASEVLKTHDLSFASRAQFKAFKKLMFDAKNITFKRYGELWRQLKSIFVLQLLSTKRVRSFCSIREEETTLLVKKIRESSGRVDLSEMFAEFSTDLIYRSVLGFKYRELGNEKNLLLMLVDLMELLGFINIDDFVPWLGWINRVRGFDARLEKVAAEIDDFLEDVTEQRLKSGRNSGGDNFIDILLEIHKDGDSIGRNGGTDTVSTALEWTMSELLRHPTVMEKLQNELRGVVKDKHNISEHDLEEMHYMKAVIKETLRYYPLVALLVPREGRHDVKIKGYDVSKGTVIIVNVWAIERDLACWDEPEKFKPERFLKCSTYSEGSSFGWIPFGGGRRGCPGSTYGMATVELLLANIVHKFDWKLPQGVVLDMTDCAGLATHRVVPLVAVASMPA